MKYSHPKLVEHITSQYALGTLRGGAARRMQRLLQQRVDLQLAVQQWQQRLATLQLHDTKPVQQVSPQVWQAIAERTRPALNTRDQQVAVTKPGWFGGGLAGLSAAFAAGLTLAGAVLLIAPAAFISSDRIAMQAGERLPQSYVGLLTDAQGAGKVLVSSLRHGKTMTIKMIGPVDNSAYPNTQLVLWAVPKEGPAFAVGTLPDKGSATSQLSDTSEKLLSKVSTLIVTREQTAQPATPSADVVLRGNCAKLW